jgi:hypothetical protein
MRNLEYVETVLVLYSWQIQPPPEIAARPGSAVWQLDQIGRGPFVGGFGMGRSQATAYLWHDVCPQAQTHFPPSYR